MLGPEVAIFMEAHRFTHPEACRVFNAAMDQAPGRTVVVDLSRAQDATTSAFARLVLLRRELRRHGRDLKLRGMHDRVAKLYEVSRLGSVLPRN
jgi:ABC-type transporter Mla MlaB component